MATPRHGGKQANKGNARGATDEEMVEPRGIEPLTFAMPLP